MVRHARRPGGRARERLHFLHGGLQPRACAQGLGPGAARVVEGSCQRLRCAGGQRRPAVPAALRRARQRLGQLLGAAHAAHGAAALRHPAALAAQAALDDEARHRRQLVALRAAAALPLHVHAAAHVSLRRLLRVLPHLHAAAGHLRAAALPRRLRA
eukprot:scaffold20992_cov62-Phaeocystis_antarctica.AAC.4